MGIFKQMKDMKAMVQAAPAMVEEAQHMQAQAQQMQAAQAAAMPGMAGGMPAPIAPDDPILAPIAGIDLPRYAQLAKAVGVHGLKNQEQIDGYMARAGHSAEAWQQAYDGWNERFKANLSLSTLYAQHYHAATV